MEVDAAMQRLGVTGRWQCCLYAIILASVKTQAAWTMLSIIWIGHRPPHHCKVPANSSLQEWIPYEPSGKLTSCSMYANPLNHTTNDTTDYTTIQTTTCVHGWDFDLSESGPTIVTKWNLVCEHGYMVETTQTIFAFGLALGAFLGTRISDKFGRKWVMVANGLLVSICGLLTTTVQTMALFYVVMAFNGVFVGGALGAAFIYLSESFSSTSRDCYLILMSAHWGMALAFLPLISWVAHNWIYYEWFISLYGLVLLPLPIWWLPETVPWLHANNRLEEAEKVLLRAAKMNRISFPSPLLKPLEGLEKDSEKDGFLGDKPNGNDQITEVRLKSCKLNKRNGGCLGSLKNKCKPQKTHLKTQYSLFELVRNPYLRRHMVIAFILFFDNICYYGATYISGSLSTNRFLSGFLGVLVEIPACIIIYLLINRFGRRKPFLLFRLIASISIISCVFILGGQSDISSYATLVLYMFFKFCISGAFAVMIIYGAEMFPTNLRNQAFGVCMCFARLGNILASYSLTVVDLYPRMTYAGLGLMALAGGALVLLLPETFHKALPETIEDIEGWYADGGGGCCGGGGGGAGCYGGRGGRGGGRDGDGSDGGRDGGVGC